MGADPAKTNRAFGSNQTGSVKHPLLVGDARRYDVRWDQEEWMEPSPLDILIEREELAAKANDAGAGSRHLAGLVKPDNADNGG